MKDPWDKLIDDAVREGRLPQLIDYFERNRKASRGEQAHDYCHGTNCISCGCSETGPCVSHRPLKPPVHAATATPRRSAIKSASAS